MKGYLVKNYHQPVKRYCQTLSLTDQPHLIEAYKDLHRKENIWPETLAAIKASGILDMEIYLLENRLFMIVELPADLEWEETMQKMAAMPKQKEWEAFVAQYQQADAHAKSDEKWQLMERIFHVYE